MESINNIPWFSVSDLDELVRLYAELLIKGDSV